MSRKNTLAAKGYEHENFADLLKDLNKEKVITEENAMASKCDKQQNTAFKDSKDRQRMMSNEKIKFLCSSADGIIHDKRCMCAKSIPDEDAEWLEEYKKEYNPCPECMIRAYISAGAYDPKEYAKYEEFFAKIRMTNDQIKNIYVEQGMKTKIYQETLTIWYREDTWKIKALSKNGHVQLLHNNYVRRKNGVREFTPGFHIQNALCKDTNITYALNLVTNYSYNPEESALHNTNGKQILKDDEWQKVDANAVSLENMLEQTTDTKKKTLWENIKYSVKRLFVHSSSQRNDFFDTYGFYKVTDCGYPEHQTICIYIWKDKQGQYLWQNGIYNQKLKHFSVSYGTTVYAIKQSKVVAWKKMNEDALTLDIKSEN